MGSRNPGQRGQRAWLRDVSIHSLRVRILMGFLLVSLTTFCIAALGYWYQRQVVKLSQVRALSEKVLLDVVRLQKAEAEFNSAGIVQPSFFTSGQHISLQDHAGSYMSITQSLRELDASLPHVMPESQKSHLHQKISTMLLNAEKLQADFKQYTSLMQHRGFLSYGLLGEMRETAHQMEDLGKLDAVDVLQLRRHEKDYLLRRDTTYYSKNRVLGQSLIAMAQARPGMQEDVLRLQAYLGKFEVVVRMEGELGIIGSNGLQQRIAAASTQLAAQVDELNALLLQESVAMGDRYRFIFIGLAGMAVLLTIILSLYFSAKITQPVRKLTRFMRHEVETQFQDGSPLLSLQGRGELRDLGADVNLMVQQIRKQLTEITAQSVALGQRNLDLMQLNAELEHTQEKQAALLRVREKIHSIISHDLRAPMNGMTAYLNLILESPDTFTPEQTEKFARQMLQSVKRLGDMMENLLRWSLFHSGELVCEPVRVQLNAAIARNLDLYAEAAAKKEVKLLQILPVEHDVHADSEMLDFILRNLITNAIKFSKTGGAVTVTAQESGEGWVSIRICDQGVGMTQDQINRILVKGEHITTSGTQKEKGTGFGLMLCRDFVERLGGRLTVDSAPSEGTTVTFTLPRSTHPGVAVTSEQLSLEH